MIENGITSQKTGLFRERVSKEEAQKKALGLIRAQIDTLENLASEKASAEFKENIQITLEGLRLLADCTEQYPEGLKQIKSLMGDYYQMKQEILWPDLVTMVYPNNSIVKGALADQGFVNYVGQQPSLKTEDTETQAHAIIKKAQALYKSKEEENAVSNLLNEEGLANHVETNSPYKVHQQDPEEQITLEETSQKDQTLQKQESRQASISDAEPPQSEQLQQLAFENKEDSSTWSSSQDEMEESLQNSEQTETPLENNITKKILIKRGLPIPALNSEDLNERTIAKLINRLPLKKDERVYAKDKLKTIKKDAKKGRKTTSGEYDFVYIHNEDLISKKAMRQ